MLYRPQSIFLVITIIALCLMVLLMPTWSKEVREPDLQLEQETSADLYTRRESLHGSPVSIMPSLLVLLGPPHIRHLARNCFPIHAFHRPPHALAAPRSLRSDSEFRHQSSQRLVFFLRKMPLAQTRVDVAPPAVQHSVVQGRRGARM